MRYAESLGLEWTMEDMAALRKEATGGYEDGLEDLSEEELSRSRAVYLRPQPPLPDPLRQLLPRAPLRQLLARASSSQGRGQEPLRQEADGKTLRGHRRGPSGRHGDTTRSFDTRPFVIGDRDAGPSGHS